jgi:hypothetical protein
MGRPAWESQGAIHSNFGASTGARRHTPGLAILVRARSAYLGPRSANFSSKPERGRSFGDIG